MSAQTTKANKGNGGEQEPTCETCPYWYRLDKDSGLCRLLPPRIFALKGQAIIVPGKSPVPQYNVTPLFPTTGQDWWCGKHPDRDPQLAVMDTIQDMLKVAAQKLGIDLELLR
jgi:hypothetical protein